MGKAVLLRHTGDPSTHPMPSLCPDVIEVLFCIGGVHEVHGLCLEFVQRRLYVGLGLFLLTTCGFGSPRHPMPGAQEI